MGRGCVRGGVGGEKEIYEDLVSTVVIELFLEERLTMLSCSRKLNMNKYLTCKS